MREAAFAYYSRGSFYGRPSAYVLYELAHALKREGCEGGAPPWLAAVGLADHMLHSRISPEAGQAAVRELASRVAENPLAESSGLVNLEAALGGGGEGGEGAQVRLRAQRLGLAGAPVELAAETSVEDIIATLGQGRAPALVVIDSIQTMWTDRVESTPGTVTQVRASAQALIRYAKTTGAIVILVGHVTKDGQLAGPRVIEHMVDAVMSFEGEGGHHFRILRSLKNRFGPTDEIGVFEMTGLGLGEVANPSAMFLSGRDASAPGAAVLAGMEGSRPVLVEVQALVAPTSLGTPRRSVVGWDPARLSMVLAVLEAHGGLRLGQHDVYLNVAGGLRVSEPAADLAAAAALVSSLTGAVLPRKTVYFGEIGLSGAVRPVVHANLRLKESAKLGFEAAIAPLAAREDGETSPVPVAHCEHISKLIADIAASGAQARSARELRRA